jgi:hypothetical protein
MRSKLSKGQQTSPMLSYPCCTSARYGDYTRTVDAYFGASRWQDRVDARDNGTNDFGRFKRARDAKKLDH